MFLINTPDEALEIKLEKYDNGATSVFIEAVTADGYDLFAELSKEEKSAIISLLYESLYPNSHIEELRDIIGKCRSENKDKKLSSMLGEAGTILSEIADFAEEYEECT